MPEAGGGGGRGRGRERGGRGRGGGGHIFGDIERTHSRSLIPAVESSSPENSGDECATTRESQGRREVPDYVRMERQTPPSSFSNSYSTNASPILRPSQTPTVLTHTPVKSDTSRHASPHKGTDPRLASGAPGSKTGPSSANKGVSPKDLEERLLALLPRYEDE
jgi:hypothetical protein